MKNSSVALLIKEPDSPRVRYVEVEHIPFTVGNAANADVVLRSANEAVRLQIVKSGGFFCAQNLAGSKPGQALRTIKLANKTRFKTGGVVLQFFTTTLSATAMAERMVAMDLEVEKVRAFDDVDEAVNTTSELEAAPELEHAFVSPTATPEQPALAVHEESVHEELVREEPVHAVSVAPVEHPSSATVTATETLIPKNLSAPAPVARSRVGNRHASSARLQSAAATDELIERAKLLLSRLDELSDKIDALPKLSSEETRVAS